MSKRIASMLVLVPAIVVHLAAIVWFVDMAAQLVVDWLHSRFNGMAWWWIVALALLAVPVAGISVAVWSWAESMLDTDQEV